MGSFFQRKCSRKLDVCFRISNFCIGCVKTSRENKRVKLLKMKLQVAEYDSKNLNRFRKQSFVWLVEFFVRQSNFVLVAIKIKGHAKELREEKCQAPVLCVILFKLPSFGLKFQERDFFLNH